MSDEITLEVELDLPLDPEDIARYRAYIASGAGERDAAIQTAQDMLMLGGTGAVVQGAEAVTRAVREALWAYGKQSHPDDHSELLLREAAQRIVRLIV